MPKKTATIETSATPAPRARAAKPNTTRVTAPRVTTAKHSKAKAVAVAQNPPQPEPGEAIAKIAYGYWETRGYRGGSALEDWVRAEEEYRLCLA